MRAVVSLALIGALWVQDDGWSHVLQLSPHADVQVDTEEPASYRGTFRVADDQSITVMIGTQEHTVPRGLVRRISLNRGAHHLRRNVAIAVLAAGLVTTLTCVGKDTGCMEASPLTFYPLAGAGALIGAVVPSGDWEDVYRR